MKPLVQQFCFRSTPVALAVLAAFGVARAEEASESAVEAYVSVGAAAVSGDPKDRALFGQYNGLRDDDVYGLLDFGYSRRDAATGTWTDFFGTNLMLDTRELGFLWKRQGNWRVTANYGELVRRDPYTLNTGLAGAGSTTPQVVHLGGGPGTGATFDLETKRKGLGAGFGKWITPALEFTADIKRENKDGSRLWGIGMSCPSSLAPGCGPTTATATGSAVLQLPEPIDANHTQAEARLTYAGQQLTVSGGYYGSFYKNDNSAMRPGIPASLNNPVGVLLPLSAGLQSFLSSAVALPPENEAHQFDVSGAYSFTPNIRANFKLAYATARQDQDFASAGLSNPPAGVSNLDARVDTTLAQFAISARPIPKLSLMADWRYEDKDDETPLSAYLVEPGLTSTNRAYSTTRIRSKAQATYQLPYRFSTTAGVDYEYFERGSFTSTNVVRGVSALRKETEELGFRLELRRQLTETISGSLSYITTERDGSNWLRPNAGTGVTEITDTATGFPANAIFAPNLADRDRDKLRLFTSWQATDELSLQLTVESGKDTFSAPSNYALRESKLELYSLDGNYLLSEKWSLSAFVSYGSQKLDQARPEGYVLGYDNKNTMAGIGVNGKPSEKLEFGGSLSYIEDKSEYDQGLDPAANANSAALLAATGGLPEIVFRRTELRLFGKYALSEKSSLRLDAIYQNAKYNDWAYGFNGVTYTYGDNTTVTQEQTQDVGYVGISYTYSWR
jgi:MtrB/PioB family decaheme-associated outer membrane protein